ncbi:MAG: hypothetical protein MJK18_04910, partial [Bdellovibrionales bacterium]|nr:hypothetical protein [Bdellovibrionales bacterium]
MLTALIIVSSILFLTSSILLWRWLTHYRELIQLRERVQRKDQEIKEQDSRIQLFKDEMKATFASVASDTLQGSNKEFLKMAELTLSKHQQSAEHNLEKKKSEIDNIVNPLKESLSHFQKEVNTMEKERQRSYAV